MEQKAEKGVGSECVVSGTAVEKKKKRKKVVGRRRLLFWLQQSQREMGDRRRVYIIACLVLAIVGICLDSCLMVRSWSSFASFNETTNGGGGATSFASRLVFTILLLLLLLVDVDDDGQKHRAGFFLFSSLGEAICSGQWGTHGPSSVDRASIKKYKKKKTREFEQMLLETHSDTLISVWWFITTSWRSTILPRPPVFFFFLLVAL